MREKIKTEFNLIISTEAQKGEHNRSLYLDTAKGIAIILVVLGHSGFVTSYTDVLLSTFHLPIFFFISGLLFTMKKEGSLPFKVFIKKRLLSLGVPYIFFSLITIILILIQGLGNDIIYEALQTTIMFQGYSILWFLPTLFLSELFMWLASKLKFPIIGLLIFLGLSLGSFYMFKHTMLYPYFLVPITGNYYTSEAVYAWFRLLVKAFIGAFFMCTAALLTPVFTRKASFSLPELVLGLLIFAINLVSARHLTICALNYLWIDNLPAYLALGITGSVGLLLFVKNLPTFAPLSYFGRNSLTVMCTHMNLSLLHYAYLISLLFIQTDSIYLTALLTVSITVLMEFPIIFILNTLFPWALGKRH